MSWLLDSDILIQPAKKVGDARVITGLEKHQHECYTSSIVIAQLAFWVRTKRRKQRVALQKWLTELLDAMHGRILWIQRLGRSRMGGSAIPAADGRQAYAG
jgi:predicted nucleic acid-binding protein